MKEMIVYLMRHARHDDYGLRLTGRGPTDCGLSPDGRAEARRRAASLARRRIRTIQASPRRRARETAEILGEELGIPVEIAPGLDEVNFGDWTGSAFAELEADDRWKRWNRTRSTARAPEGEWMAEAVLRIVRHLAALHAEGRSDLLCVTHCDIIRGAVAYYLGLDLDNILRFDIDPASLTVLAFHQDGARLISLNERL